MNPTSTRWRAAWCAFVVIAAACSSEPANPHEQAVERLSEFPAEASEFQDPKLRSLELVRHEDQDEVMALLPIEPGMNTG